MWVEEKQLSFSRGKHKSAVLRHGYNKTEQFCVDISRSRTTVLQSNYLFTVNKSVIVLPSSDGADAKSKLLRPMACFPAC